MRDTLAVFLHELRSRRFVLLLVAASVVLVLLAPLLPGVGDQRASEPRELAAAILAAALGYGLAAVLGANTFAGDLAEHRLSFFFARPVGGLSLWLGRIGAAAALVAIAEGAVIVTALLANRGSFDLLLTLGWWAVPVLIVGPLLALLTAHAAGIMLRDRSPWLLLDLTGGIAAGVACWLALRPVMLWCSTEALIAAAAVFTLAVLVALFVAGAAGVVVGRSSLRRSHGALSLALWLVIAVGWVAGVAYARWLDHFGPHDLSRVQALDLADPTGDWVVVSGRSSARFDTFRRFLVSADGKDAVPIRLEDRWANWLNQQSAFAASGEVAAWLEDGRLEHARAIWWADLESRPLAPIATTIEVTGWHVLALSPAGTRLLLRDSAGLVSVYDLALEKLLATARIAEDNDDHPMCVFAEEDVVRCYTVRIEASTVTALRIHELDVGSGHLALTGVADPVPPDFMPYFSPMSLQLLNLAGCPDEDCRLQLFNPLTAALESEVALPEGTWDATFLADGRVLCVEGTQSETRAVSVQNNAGEGWIRRPFSDPAKVVVGAEVEPGRITVFRGELRDDDATFWACRQAEVLDLATGETRAVTPCSGGRRDCVEVQFGFWANRAPAVWSQSAWRFFLDDRGALVRWDPETDTLTTVAGSG